MESELTSLPSVGGKKSAGKKETATEPDEWVTVDAKRSREFTVSIVEDKKYRVQKSLVGSVRFSFS